MHEVKERLGVIRRPQLINTKFRVEKLITKVSKEGIDGAGSENVHSGLKNPSPREGGARAPGRRVGDTHTLVIVSGVTMTCDSLGRIIPS